MRNRQFRGVNHPVMVKDNVQVENPWSESYVFSPPAGIGFDPFEPLQKL
jgi:hypothetical protein